MMRSMCPLTRAAACRECHERVFLHMLGIFRAKEPDEVADKLAAVNADKLVAQLQHQAASHLFELLLLRTPAALYAAVWGLLEPRLYELCSHKASNFAVQSLIAAAPARPHVDAACKVLLPKAAELIEAQRPGILCVLAAACACWQTSCEAVCSVMAEAAGEQVRMACNSSCHALAVMQLGRRVCQGHNKQVISDKCLM